MKTIFFSQKQMPKILKKIVFSVSNIFAKIFPKTTIRVSKKYMFNPYSRRNYNFRNIPQPLIHNIASSMGNVQCMQFGNGKRHILFTHGWGDTSLRFSSIIKALPAQDYTIWCFDHIGHGNSDGSFSNLFACIESLEKTIQFIENQNHQIHQIVTHSLGGVALLTMPTEFLADKKIIITSLPVNFLGSVYLKLDDFGLSRKMMELTIDSLSQQYGRDFEGLMPKNHIAKVEENFTFIHDMNDQSAPHVDMQALVKNSNAKIITTHNFGHNNIVKSDHLLEQILSHQTHSGLS